MVSTYRNGKSDVWVTNLLQFETKSSPRGMCIGQAEPLNEGGIYVLFPTHRVAWMTSRNFRSQMNCSLNDVTRVKSVTNRETKLSESGNFLGFHEDRQVDSREDECETQDFTGDHAPINQRAYRVSPTERRIIHEEVQKMLDEGIVQPSESRGHHPLCPKGNVLPSYGLPTNSGRTYSENCYCVTDHHSLCWLMNLRILQEGLPDGPLRLQEHDFDVKYKTSKKHSDADALSRNPVEEETETPDKF
ncbi:transposon Ty3-I Gag-Pol polyprotein [Trichonephila clavipes]|nr:transposon Ty3-I Gag-Pol polyprotein [Trichonephila clavipes]